MRIQSCLVRVSDRQRGSVNPILDNMLLVSAFAYKTRYYLLL